MCTGYSQVWSVIPHHVELIPVFDDRPLLQASLKHICCHNVVTTLQLKQWVLQGANICMLAALLRTVLVAALVAGGSKRHRLLKVLLAPSRAAAGQLLLLLLQLISLILQLVLCLLI